MKTVKSVVVLFAAVAAISLVSGCASKSPLEKTVVLDHKGAAVGQPVPAWVIAGIESNSKVEQLSEYKNVNCFVVSQNSVDRDYAVAWVNNASGPAEIAAVVSTTVSSTARSALGGESGTTVSSNLDAAAEALSNASFSNARKEADWWIVVRNDTTGVQETRAFALYTIDRKNLADQVARNIQNIVDNNTAMSEAERAIYQDLINDIRNNGFRQ
jgi:hypothetical protein